ncbi:hypothetical protein MQX03_15270 [Chryseobacterium aahli]|nr:hypothetical protein [Chryseobacterium aahli]MCI3938559.1 hypothetical protein [Chryseobacterium aahli]
MGKSKSIRSQILTNSTVYHPIEKQLHSTSNFAEEINDKTVDIQIPQEE